MTYRYKMNMPGEGGIVGESLGGGTWYFGDDLGSLWGDSVAIHI